MKWSEVVQRVAEDTGQSQAATRAVLSSFITVCIEAVVDGEDIRIPRIGTLSSRWSNGRSLRAIGDARKIRLDGRFVPRFRPAKALRDALAGRTPQRWQDPRHQAAWQLAEALISDLDLYHSAKAPMHLTPNQDPTDVLEQSARSFGPLWTRVVRTYEQQIPEQVRSEVNHLGLVAREQWSSAAP